MLKYPIKFLDPSTIFCYNLISVHHDAFWFIVVIISLVGWCLFKILKEFSWNVMTKNQAF